MWNGIGGNVMSRQAYRDRRADDAFDRITGTASSIEKMIANNNMRNAIMDFYNGRRAAAEEAARAEDIAAGGYVDDVLGNEQALMELDGLDDSDLLGDTVFNDDGTIGMGRTFQRLQEKGIPFKSQDQVFAENFDPNAQNSVEDIQRMQRLMGMDENDVKVGKWGPKSRAAYRKFKGV